MSTIERVVGMHNYVPEANTDKVWAGVVVRVDTGFYQFVALNGRRGGFMRASPQLPNPSPTAVYTKFESMHREKLAHGYREIDWTQAQYGMLQGIAALGSISDTVVNSRPWDDNSPLPPPTAPVPVQPSGAIPVEPVADELRAQLRKARTLDF